MRPPECAVCGADLDDTGGLVHFARTPSDQAWHDRMKAQQMVGHPPDVEWFCGAHLEAARARAHQPCAEAVAALRQAERPTSSTSPAPPSAPPTPPAPRAARLVWRERRLDPAVPAGPVRVALEQALAPAAAALGHRQPLALKVTTRRAWTPMDRVQPPHCPYVDHRETVADPAPPGGEARVEERVACWNPDEVASVSLRAEVSVGDRAVAIRLGGTGQGDGLEVMMVGIRPSTADPDVDRARQILVTAVEAVAAR